MSPPSSTWGCSFITRGGGHHHGPKVVLIDDLDGTEAAETITFSIDGVTTEIDLSKQNAANLL